MVLGGILVIGFAWLIHFALDIVDPKQTLSHLYRCETGVPEKASAAFNRRAS